MKTLFRVSSVPRGALQFILTGDQDLRGFIRSPAGYGHSLHIVALMDVPVGFDFSADQFHAVGARYHGSLKEGLGALVSR